MSVAEAALSRVCAVAAEAPSAWLVLVGPTASGKSDLALAAASAVGGEVVSADSVQIVRGFDVGSGKPTVEERSRIPHHLIDAVGPLESIDASRFATMADESARDIERRGKRVIVCGGTFLWVRALVWGLVDAPAADIAIRDTHKAFALREGRPALHEKLANVDPASAARLHPNDLVRVSRALEVFQTTGQRLSDLQAGHGFRTARRAVRLFGVTRSQDELTARIRARVRAWLTGGWIDETRALLDAGFGGARAMSSVGYREVASHLRGELPREELEEAIVRATRVYARRQRTFLKQAEVEWLPAP